jgi:hypothetical protein
LTVGTKREDDDPLYHGVNMGQKMVDYPNLPEKKFEKKK